MRLEPTEQDFDYLAFQLNMKDNDLLFNHSDNSYHTEISLWLYEYQIKNKRCEIYADGVALLKKVIDYYEKKYPSIKR